jgi:hypothetical protein
MLEQVLEMTPTLRHSWHLLTRLLNTVWSSFLDIADTVHLMKQLLHDSPTASLIVGHMVTLNHISCVAQFNLLYDKHVTHSVEQIHTFIHLCAFVGFIIISNYLMHIYGSFKK